MRADTVREEVQRGRAAATVQWVDTPQWATSLARLQTIASPVMLADTAQEVAHRVPAVATVRWVGTPRSEALVLEQTTA